MDSIVLASRNRGKIREYEDLFLKTPFKLRGIGEFPDVPDVIEDGDSFEENALKKAHTISKYLNLPAISDDSGLVIPVLGGAPGLHSARFFGSEITDEERCKRILELMEGKKERYAFFVCVICIAVPSGKARFYKGRCDGEITYELLGKEGFGYDPIFYYPPYKKTFAQMKMQEKNSVSHRARAIQSLKEDMGNLINWIRENMVDNPPQ